MLCILNNSTDPWFNLAAEEYLLKNFSESFFMLWRNEKSIIVGKHQNTLAEINTEYILNQKIPVVRRISGGGTVYHDPGNLNYTFIINGEKGNLVDFKRCIKPVLEILQKLSLNASLRGKSDLVIDNRKISGNAMHVFKKRVLHHGTLLFNSDLSELQKALSSDPSIYRGKSVQSIRSQVTNIKDHLITDIDIFEFQNLIINHILKNYPGSASWEFSEADKSNIKKIRNKKYIKWNWNYGYSPDYELKKKIILNGEKLTVTLRVSEGIIKEAHIETDNPHENLWKTLETKLQGIRHNKNELTKKLAGISPSEIPGFEISQFVKNLF